MKILFQIVLLCTPLFLYSQGNFYTREIQADSLLADEKLSEAAEIYTQIIEDLKIKKGNAEYHILYKAGYSLAMDGKEKNALPYLMEVKIRAGYNKDSVILAKCYSVLGRVYQYLGKPDSSFYYFREALSVWEVKNNINGLAGSYQDIAQILRITKRTEAAKTYINKAIRLISLVNDAKIVANVLNEKAYLCELQNQLDSAKYYYLKLVEVSEKLNNLKGISAGYSNLASVLTSEKKYEEALKYYNLGLQIDLELNYDYYLTCSYRGIADCYYHMGDYPKSLAYIKMAEIYCDSNWLNDKFILEEYKYKFYKASGKFKDALIAHERLDILEDSMLSIENQKNISEILTKYETEKKEQQIKLLDNNNRLNAQKIKTRNLMLAVSILLLISLFMLAVNIIQAKNRRISQIEVELHTFVSKLNIEETKEENRNEDGLVKYSRLGLTQRESEILDLMQKGLTNKQIGEKLFVSENTIKFHLKNIYIKLDVKNRIQAVNKAV